MEPLLNDALQQSASPGRKIDQQKTSRRYLRKQLFYTSHDKDRAASLSSTNSVRIPSETTSHRMDNQNQTIINNPTTPHAKCSHPTRKWTWRNNPPLLSLLPALIFLLLSSFHIHSSSSSEITSFQQNGGGIGAGSTGTNNNNNFNSNNILSNNGIYSNNDNNDDAASIMGSTTASSSFQQSAAASAFIPSTSPDSSFADPSQSLSVPTSVFIDGLANAIRKINSTEFLQLTTDAPFELQFRTACHFGNIVYDDNILIKINSLGKIAYSYSSNFSAQVYDHEVADRQWQTIKFQGNRILIVNEIKNPSIEWSDPNSTSAEKAEHYFSFFDGFVGCIRIPMDQNENPDRSSSDYNDHEDTFHESPQSPSEHRILSLMKLFGLTNAQSDPRCENAFDEIVSSHPCFEPNSFVLCEKCANSSGVCEVDGDERNNRCVCPQSVEEDRQVSGKYCNEDPSSDEPHLLRINTHEEPEESSSQSTTTTTTTSTTTPVTISTTSKRPGPLSFTWNTEEVPCPCKNGGQCETYSNDQKICNCTGTRHNGIYCQLSINQCEVTPGICNNGVCHDNRNGTFQCYCKPGYAGKFCDKNILECLSSPCQNGGTCIDGIDEYTCECALGYTGSDCQIEINECDPNPCENGATCEDQIGKYECHCVEGFTDLNCTINIDDCASSPCQNGGVCNDGINSFSCDCTDTGFEGDACQNNVDDCINSDCQNGGSCNDLLKGYNCTCNLGYTGEKCETDIDECQSSPCMNDGECFQRSNQSLYDLPDDNPLASVFPTSFDYRTASGYKCICVPGYNGTECEIDIDDCVRGPDEPSLCNNGTCHDGVNNYRCQCHTGYTGDKCEIDIDECASNPCQNGASCQDEVGDFKCHCTPNYGAKSCDVKLIGCKQYQGRPESPCSSFTKECIPSYDQLADQHHFKCKCEEGYAGERCELSTTMSFNATGPVVINHLPNPEGNYELLFWFKTTLSNVILAVGSGGTYFSLTAKDGKLNLRSSLLNILDGIYSGSNLSNAEWHKVWISINSSHIALAADSEQTIYPVTLHGDAERKEDQQGPFNVTYIGGFTTETNFLNQGKLGFSGCIRDVQINQERKILDFNLFNATTVQKGCTRKDQCKDPNPCLNDGVCLDKWHKYKCECKRPYLGNQCQLEYTAGTFYHENSNNSLVSVEIPNDIGMKFSNGLGVSMIVRTKQKTGTIFLLGHENKGNYSVFLKAEITENGNLLVQGKWSDAATDSKADPYPVDSLQISDGYYHYISIQRDNNLVTIHVNETEHFRKKVSNNMRFVPNVLFIGGEPSFSNKGMEVSTATAPEVSSLVNSGDTENADIPPTSISGEDSTALPEEVSGRENGVSGEESAMVHGEPDRVNTTIVVSRPFKGLIQDFRVNGSGFSGAQGMQDHNQNHYVVEFFPLNPNSTDSMGMPLGVVKRQNVLEGIVSDDTCKNNPCLEGGTCTVTWNDFQCDCTPEYAGRICDNRLRCADVNCPENTICRNIDLHGFECYSEIAFDGKQNMSPHYVLKSSEKENLTISFNEISFRFRTKQRGTILHITNEYSSFQIGLEKYDLASSNGSIVVVINGNVHQNASMNILNGEWHTVTSKLTRLPDTVGETQLLRVYVDSDPNRKLSSDDLTTNSTSILNIPLDGNFFRDLIMANNTDIVLGSRIDHSNRYNHEDMSDMGHPESAHNQFYRGCLADVRVGDFALPVVTPLELKDANPNPSNRSFVDITAPVEFYIQEHNNEKLNLGCVLCYESECLNNGFCANRTEKYECDCLKGFEGDTCDVNIDECKNNECQNQSECRDKIAGYECICQPGYAGDLCDENIDECEKSKCVNGGTCHDGINQYSCQCTDEFTGRFCESRKKAHCSDNPCENAKCKELREPKESGVFFECQCLEGWTGEICSERVNYCQNITCSDVGTCHNNYNAYGFDCDCDPGYGGPTCAENIDECASNPCLNKGQCKDDINHFVCNCTGTGFTGFTCEEEVDECLTETHNCLPPQLCENTIGSFRCVCDDRKKCGLQCEIEDPCFENGNVTCLNGGTCESDCPNEEGKSWRCSCLKDFGGEYCDLLTMARPTQPLDILLIIIPVLAALLIAATVAIVILVRMARRKRATRGVYSPSQQEYCNPRVELDNVMKPPPEERLI